MTRRHSSEAAATVVLLILALILLEQRRRGQLGAWLRAKFLNQDGPAAPGATAGGKPGKTSGGSGGGSRRESGLPQLGLGVPTDVEAPPVVEAPQVARPERQPQRLPVGGLGLPAGAV